MVIELLSLWQGSLSGNVDAVMGEKKTSLGLAEVYSPNFRYVVVQYTRRLSILSYLDDLSRINTVCIEAVDTLYLVKTSTSEDLELFPLIWEKIQSHSSYLLLIIFIGSLARTVSYNLLFFTFLGPGLLLRPTYQTYYSLLGGSRYHIRIGNLEKYGKIKIHEETKTWNILLMVFRHRIRRSNYARRRRHQICEITFVRLP